MINNNNKYIGNFNIEKTAVSDTYGKLPGGPAELGSGSEKSG